MKNTVLDKMLSLPLDPNPRKKIQLDVKLKFVLRTNREAVALVITTTVMLNPHVSKFKGFTSMMWVIIPGRTSKGVYLAGEKNLSVKTEPS